MPQDSVTASPTQPDLAPLVDVRALVHERGGRRLLDEVTFTIRRGEYVALMGPNGSGKTTLVRHFNGLLLPSKGEVRIMGQPTSNPKHLETIRRTVGLVFQDPDDQMVAVTVEDEIAFGLENRLWDRERMIARVEEALERFHLTHVRERQTTSLSGGEQQRVAVAAIWATDPALLVLDEPTSMLDRPSAAELLDLLDSLAGQRTILHVTQHVREARRAGRLIVMSAGRVVLDGPPEEVLADENRLCELGILRRERRLGAPRTRSSEAALEAVDVTHVRRDGPREEEVLRGVSAHAPRGMVLAIVGKSGSGKSTLAWHFNRLLEPATGVIRLDGSDVRTMPLAKVRREVGLTFQRVDLQLFEATVADDVAFGLLQQGVSHEESRARAAETLESLGLPFEEYAARRPVTLSAGEQRRVALAGVLVMNPAVLVLDEPTSGLDAHGVDALVAHIEALRDAGHALVVVTHDLEFAAQVADLVLPVEEGRGTVSAEVEQTLAGLIEAWTGKKAE